LYSASSINLHFLVESDPKIHKLYSYAFFGIYASPSKQEKNRNGSITQKNRRRDDL